MRAFADLLESLLFTPGRNAKLAHLQAYFRDIPDPDRGWTVSRSCTGSAGHRMAVAPTSRFKARSQTNIACFEETADE